MIRALILAGPRQAEALEPWLDYLGRTGGVEVEVVSDPGVLTRLGGFDVVVAHAPETDLDSDAEAGLCEFILGGGGFVGLHCTNSRWSGARRYSQLAGGSGGGRLPRAEILSHVATRGHDITRRLAGEIVLEDTCFAQEGLAQPCEVLLTTTWRSRELPVAYARPAGRGRIFYCGLGEADASYAAPSFQELLYRGLRHAAGRDEATSIGLGMLGFGAIGKEHTSAIARVPGLELRAVCDRNPERVAAALGEAPDARVAADLDGLLSRPEIDAIVISTPPNTHGPLALLALEAGKHVVVEKPFCFTGDEADQLVEVAGAAGLTLTVYQSRRWDADFLALQQIISTGVLGDVFHLEAFVGGFQHPCHLWHSDAAVSGGVVFDWGSHYLDWILQLIPGEVVQVSASRHNLVWHDVTNDDHFELRLRFESGVEAQFIHSDIAAARKPKWYVLGTRGAALGLWHEGVLPTRGPNGITEVMVPVADWPCELHLLTPGPGGRSHDQTVVLPASPPQAFYRNLAGHLLAQEPLAVTAESARRNIAVMEAATSAAASGQPMAVAI
ncbi:MAG: Gfo/Idh/MocA family oxidoreductase [Candidatus Dormibacteria bacterium]